MQILKDMPVFSSRYREAFPDCPLLSHLNSFSGIDGQVYSLIIS